LALFQSTPPTRAATQLAARIQEAVKESDRVMKQMFNSLEHGLASSLVHWRGFAQTIKSVFQTLGTDVLRIMLHALLAPLEKAFGALITGLVTKLVTFLGLSQAKTSVTDVAEVTGAGAVGGAMAAAAAAPFFWWNPGLAIAIGEAMNASILGAFAAQAAFREGGIVPFDMLASVHAQEMVLPADIAVPLRTMIQSQGPLGTGGGVHFNNCNFSGVTRDLVRAVGNQMISQARLAGMNA
jgi:hypothetical protein